jgi:hypothetical protein
MAAYSQRVGEGGDMQRYLIVANQTLAGEHMMEEVLRLVGEGRCAFHVIVPATPTADQWVYTEGEAIAVAEDRLEQFLGQFQDVDAEITGEVGDDKPLDAIQDALREQTYDGIILSTLPQGISRWLGMDLVTRLERAVDIPVRHIVGEPAAAARNTG